MNDKTRIQLSTVFVWSILAVAALVFLAWAASAFFGSTDGATDWRGLIPMAMALAIPCALVAAAIFIPLSRRRYRRESQRRIDAARVALADRAKVGPSTADPKDLRFARPADADHPAWHYTGSKD